MNNNFSNKVADTSRVVIYRYNLTLLFVLIIIIKQLENNRSRPVGIVRKNIKISMI